MGVNMKTNIMQKSNLTIISLITLMLFLAGNSYAGDNNKINQIPGVTSGKVILLAKGQYYVPPPSQKDQCSCCSCATCSKG